MSDDESYKNALTEWQEARATISKCDGCLDSLRRYGFTVIAGLLAVDAIQSYINLGNPAKIGLIVITIAFIVGLYILDIYYQRIIEAATIRARILETVVLNFELNETLSDRFEQEDLKKYIKWIYIGFILIAVLIGITVVISAAPSPLTTTSINSSINTTSSNSGIPSNFSVNSTLVHSTSTNMVDSGTLSTKVVNSSTLSTNVINTSTSSTKVVNSSTLSTTEASYVDWLHIQENDKKSIIKLISPWSFFIIIIIMLIIKHIIEHIIKYIKSQKADNTRKISTRKILTRITRILRKISTGISIIYVSSFIYLITSVFVTIVYYITPNLNYEINILFILFFMLASIGAIGASFIELFTNIRIDYSVKEERHKKGSEYFEDWVIDRVSCKLNEKVKITVTNLHEEPIQFTNKKFCVIELIGGSYRHTIEVEDNISIPRYGTYSRLWDTSMLADDNITKPEKGIYRIKPRDWEVPLRRTIVVSESAKEEKPTVTKGTWTVKGEGEFTVKGEENKS